MQNRYAKMLGSLLLSSCVAAPVTAEDDTKQQRVRFESVTSGSTVAGTITGSEVTDYLIGASAGQTMTVAMTVMMRPIISMVV